LKIKATYGYGKRIDIKSAAVESFGKAFLLPLDVVLGGIHLLIKKGREYLIE